METRFRMKCKACGHWNRIEVEKHFIEQPSPEPEAHAHTAPDSSMVWPYVFAKAKKVRFRDFLEMQNVHISTLLSFARRLFLKPE